MVCSCDSIPNRKVLILCLSKRARFSFPSTVSIQRRWPERREISKSAVSLFVSLGSLLFLETVRTGELFPFRLYRAIELLDGSLLVHETDLGGFPSFLL